ncbi:hypothetical protein [Bacillus velezensis]
MMYYLMFLVAVLPITPAFVWLIEEYEICDALKEFHKKIFAKKRLSKKFGTSKKTIRDYLRIQDNLKSSMNALKHHRKHSVNLKTLINALENLLNLLDLETPRSNFFYTNDKNILLLRNFPQAFLKVYILLIRYDDSLKIILDQLLSLINGDYDDPHIKEINELRDEVTDIIVSIRREVVNTIKPYRSERNELFKIDVKHAKKNIEFEKQFIQKQRATLESALEDNSTMS